MTFTKREINEMCVDMTDDWDYANGRCVVAMITVGDSLYDKLIRWFGFTLEEWDMCDAYFDIYATLCIPKSIVTRVDVILNDKYVDGYGNLLPTEIEFNITDFPERRLMYNQLLKSGGESFKKFINEVA